MQTPTNTHIYGTHDRRKHNCNVTYLHWHSTCLKASGDRSQVKILNIKIISDYDWQYCLLKKKKTYQSSLSYGLWPPLKTHLILELFHHKFNITDNRGEASLSSPATNWCAALSVMNIFNNFGKNKYYIYKLNKTSF